MSDDLRLQMMGIGGPAAPAAAPAAPAAKQGGQGDAGYPTLQCVIAERAKTDAFLAQAKATITALEGVAEKGANAQVKADARKALRAYDHALGYVKGFASEVQKLLEAEQAKGKKAGVKKK